MKRHVSTLGINKECIFSLTQTIVSYLICQLSALGNKIFEKNETNQKEIFHDEMVKMKENLLKKAEEDKQSALKKAAKKAEKDMAKAMADAQKLQVVFLNL